MKILFVSPVNREYHRINAECLDRLRELGHEVEVFDYRTLFAKFAGNHSASLSPLKSYAAE